jgi:MATE family multidrug resistance protein
MLSEPAMPGLAREYRALIRLSWPAALTQIGLMLASVVDTLMLARVNVDALAAGALGNMWQWSLLSIGVGAVMGIDPLISQAHGRNDGRGAALALQRGLVIALLISIPLLVCQSLTGAGLRLLGQPAHLADLAEDYNLWKLPTIPCFLVYTALRQYLQSRGLMAPATVAAYAAALFNAIADWAFAFGHLGAPALGLRGIAIAGALTAFVLVLALWVTIRVLGLDTGASRAWDSESFSLAGLLQTLRIGLPVGAQMSLEAWAFTLASFMAGWISVEALGSHQIVLNMAALSFMLPFGISMGAATRVGNLIGEGDVLGMRRAVRAALTLGGGLMVFAATAFTLLRHELPLLYTDNSTLAELGARILPIAAAFQLADATQVIAGGILRGMGRPYIAALINLLGYYALALPLAYTLGFPLGLGLFGIWLALAVGLLAVALALLTAVRRCIRLPLAELQVRVGAGGGFATASETALRADPS